LHDPASPTLIFRWRIADAARKKIAEASHARESDFHAHIGDGMLPPRQQQFGLIQARLDSELVWRDSKQGLKLPDEVKRRNSRLSRNFRDRKAFFAHF
jgi:hypothetical protein